MDCQWVPILVDKGQLQGCTPRLIRRTSCPILDRAYLTRKHLCFYQIPITLDAKNTLNGAHNLTNNGGQCEKSQEWNQPSGGAMTHGNLDNNPNLGKFQTSWWMKQAYDITNGNTNLFCGRWGDRRSSSSESMFTAAEDLDQNSTDSSEISLSLFHTVIACDACYQQPCINQNIYPQHSQEHSSFTSSISQKDFNLDTFATENSLDAVSPYRYTLDACGSECESFWQNPWEDMCQFHTCEADKRSDGNFIKSTTAGEINGRFLPFSVLEENLYPGSECQTLTNLDLHSHSPRSYIFNRTEVIAQDYSRKRPKIDISLCDTPSVTWLYYDDEYFNSSEYFHEIQHLTEDVALTSAKEAGVRQDVYLLPCKSGHPLSEMTNPNQVDWQNSANDEALTMPAVHDDENGDFSTVSHNNSLEEAVLCWLYSNANQASDNELSHSISETELDSAQFFKSFSGLGRNTEEETASVGCCRPRASVINDGNRPSLYSVSGILVNSNELESIMDVPAEFTAAEVYLRRAIQAGSITEKDNSACDRMSMNKKLQMTADSGPLRSSLFLKPPQLVRDDTLTDNPSFPYGQSKENLACDAPESIVDQPPPNRQQRSSLNLIHTPVHLPLVEEKSGSALVNEQSEPETNCDSEISRRFTTQSWATIDSTEISRALKLPGGLEKSISQDSETLDTSVQSVEPAQASNVFEPQSANLLPAETVQCAHYNLQLGTFTITPALHSCNLANKLANSHYRRTVSPDPAQFIKLMKKLAVDRARSKHDRLTAPGKLPMH